MQAIPVLDREALMEHVDGDPELALHLVRLFTDDSAAMLSAIRDGLARRHAGDVEMAAHRLKGSCGVLAARAALAAATSLERAGHEGDLGRAAAAADDLERELERLRPELARVVGG